jgi:large subunit ribosomal protein L35
MAGKQKNRKAVTKRVKVTGSGKIVMRKAARNHLLQQKSQKQKNLGKNRILVSQANVARVRESVPGLGKI